MKMICCQAMMTENNIDTSSPIKKKTQATSSILQNEIMTMNSS